MQRYVCIHGHFYQPPRENPWLEEIEIQDEAYPFHDWNERITEECYAANAASRILDEDGRIQEIVNNYAHISFNIGPTLLSWLERQQPEVYLKILDADVQSRRRFGGHGSALAQVYNHMIMPLANERDQRTQVIWGIRDFTHRFGRMPEGMWLSETAVDTSTLEALAANGIRFTILEPGQAARTRPLSGGSWIDVRDGRIDPRRPYCVKLPSGARIDVFFYDGPASRAVAFEALLSSGETLARRLTGLHGTGVSGPQLAHIATDGESYGHHHRFGEMALSYALQYIEDHELAKLTNYGQFLTISPPEFEVEIVENTSWSCSHGVERWRSGCGCGALNGETWSTDWRKPLRAALDDLRDQLLVLYEDAAGKLFQDPWHARDEYIEIVLDRSPAVVDRVLTVLAGRPLSGDETILALRLLEMQRQAMLMYTSCGWFFEDVGRIETVQILEYAARAMQLAREVFGQDVEPRFLEMLEQAKSNDPLLVNGAEIFRTQVQPSVVDLSSVAAHYAMTTLFNGHDVQSEIYCYDVERQRYSVLSSGRSRLAIGRVRLTSQITRENSVLSFAVLHLGDHNLDGGVRCFRGDDAYDQMMADVGGAFRRADYSDTIRALDRHFDDHSYSLRSLFLDEQRRILDQVLDSTLNDAEQVHRRLFDDSESLMRFLGDLSAPIPRPIRVAAEVVINADLRRAFLTADFDADAVVRMIEDARNWGLNLDGEGLGFVLEQAIERRAQQLRRHPLRSAPLERLHAMVMLAEALPFHVDMRRTQDDYYHVMQTTYPEMKRAAGADEPIAARWVDEFTALGEALSVRVG